MVRGGRSPRLLGIVALLLAVAALGTLAIRNARAEISVAAPRAPSKPPDSGVTERQRVAVVRFFGTGAGVVRGAVIEALLDGGAVELLPTPALDARLGPGGSVWAQASEVAQELNLRALIHGYTRKVKRVFYATITVLAGRDGAVLGALNFSARSLPRLHAKIQATLWQRLRPVLEEAPGRAPPPPSSSIEPTAIPRENSVASTEQSEEETPPPPPPPSPPPGARRPAAGRKLRSGRSVPSDDQQLAAPPPTARSECSLVELDVAGGVLMRGFDYRDEQRGALRAYTLRRAPMGRAEATLYPFARACGLAGAFGLRVAYEQISPVDSKLADRILSTSAHAYRAELVGRASGGRWVLIPGIGYYVRSYTVGEDVVPGVNHHSVGAFVEARLRLAGVVLELGGGARRLMSAGELGSANWFPRLTGTTYTGMLRMGGAMADWLDVLLGVYAEYSVIDFHIEDTDLAPNGVAAGAHDGYLAGLLSFRLHWPGGLVHK